MTDYNPRDFRKSGRFMTSADRLLISICNKPQPLQQLGSATVSAHTFRIVRTKAAGSVGHFRSASTRVQLRNSVCHDSAHLPSWRDLAVFFFSSTKFADSPSQASCRRLSSSCTVHSCTAQGSGWTYQVQLITWFSRLHSTPISGSELHLPSTARHLSGQEKAPSLG